MKNRKPLTLKDVIDSLVIYDIEHCRFPHNYLAEVGVDIPIIGGMALDDRKKILIDIELPQEEMREVIIHELIHTKHYRLGDLPRNINQLEKHVEFETKLTYNKLYSKTKKI